MYSTSIYFCLNVVEVYTAWTLKEAVQILHHITGCNLLKKVAQFANAIKREPSKAPNRASSISLPRSASAEVA